MMRVNSGNHTVFITNIRKPKRIFPLRLLETSSPAFFNYILYTSRPKKVPLIVKTSLLLSKVFAKSKTEEKIKSPNPL